MNSKTGGLAALTLAALTLVGAPAAAQETADKTFAEAMSSGDFNLGFRYRYEYVSDDNPGLAEDTANASTVRLRMNYRTGQWRNFTAFGEFDYIGEILLNDFNNLSGDPGRDDYPVVADPKGPDLNQLYFDYDPSDRTKLRFGRQRILLDNQRFVGGVGWRQNEQTYDAFTLNMKAGGNTTFKYTFANRVRRIVGEAVPGGRHRVDAHLLNANVKLGENWAVTPYYYHLDYQDPGQFGLSNATFGVRATGSIPVGESKLALVGEFANQTDIGDNPVSYDASYINLSAAYTLPSSLSFALGYESLGGDAIVGGAAFRTPLATLHAFQGWADMFLATPDAGVEDLFLTVKYKAGKWNLTGVYHDFSAEALSADWGTEFDFSAGRSLGNGYGLLLKAALYDADQYSFDTTKFWVMLTGSY
jgi:hypothetical protein